MWINLEYLYQKIYDLLTGDYSFGWLKFLAIIIWILLAIAVPVLLYAIIYLVRRISELHAKLQAEEGESMLVAGVSAALKNPRWEKVMERLNSNNEAEWKLAIIEGDAMLDELIRDIYPHLGNNLGERLKNIEPSDFTTLQDAWDAHKIRNQIAHDHNYRLTEREARIALESYRKVFEEFHYI
jgi:hypothetical protein